MPRVYRNTLLFSANSFAAAMLALYIALALGLPRPYWALTTAYIVSQPLSGAVRSKAVYRVVGTLLGAIATVALVPNLVNSPLLLSLAMALWVSACLIVSLLDRTPKSYLLMLAGYTAALIGFPSVNQAEAVFDMATSRVVEIGLGILCATLVHSLVFPRAVGEALQGRLAAWVQDADHWLGELLRGAASEETQRSRRRLAAAASEIHILTAHLPFDTSRLRDTTGAVRALHDRMLMLLPLLSGLADRLAALNAQGASSPGLRRLLDDSGQWLAQGADCAAGQALAARLRACPAAATTNWNELLADNLRSRLAEIVEALGEAHALLGHLARPEQLSPELAQAVARAVARPLHKDLPLALRSGATALVAIMITCGLWIGLGWPDGATAAMMTAVFCCFFATLDDPAPAIADFGVYTLIGLPLAALYLFAVLPAISGFPMLVAVLAPPLLILGLYVGDPKTTGKAMPVVMAFSSALALQESFSADFASFLNGNLAQFVGIFVAIFATRAMRSISAEASVRRLVTRTWAAIGRLGRGAAPEPAAFAAVLVDRIALLTPKLATAGARQDHLADEALRDLRVAMNLMSVRQVGADLPARRRAELESVLAGVAEHYGELARRGRAEPAPALRKRLDATLEGFVRAGDAAAEPAVMGLVGLRQNLFPKAPPAQLEAA
jgi:uncharacterized membrane protein YccC